MATTTATVTTATGITATTTDTSASEVCEPPRAASRGGFRLGPSNPFPVAHVQSGRCVAT